MAKSVEGIMKRTLTTLLTFFVLIALAEGVWLCKSQENKNNKYDNARKAYSTYESHGSYFNDDEDSNSEYYRKESLNHKSLKAMLKEDSDRHDDGYGRQYLRDDYSISRTLRRADMVPRITKQKHDFLINPSFRKEAVRREINEGRSLSQGSNYGSFNENKYEYNTGN